MNSKGGLIFPDIRDNTMQSPIGRVFARDSLQPYGVEELSTLSWLFGSTHCLMEVLIDFGSPLCWLDWLAGS